MALDSRIIDEFERMHKNVTMACFDVLSQHLPGGTEENRE
jgi:hypothetical protein